MKRSWMICCTLLLVSLSGIASCYRVIFRPQDEKNVRRQLHLPADARLVSLDSSPKTAGFFGREGLRISAVFMFDDEQISNYLSTMENQSIWQPVKFINYSPRSADEYSPSALRWFDLPVPSWVDEHLGYWEHMSAVRKISRGKYYGSVITTKRGARIDHPDGNYHYDWRYVGLSFSELTEPVNMVITTFAALDLEAKKLYALIAFSG